jgi:eukaryotic-like serine/threonine-protein kinase
VPHSRRLLAWPSAWHIPPPMLAPSADVLPRRFGRYQLFDRIGRGGMAEIFLARAQLEAGISRLIVVKQIHAQLSGDPTFSRAFVDEAKLCAGLRHANIAQVVDLGRSAPEDGALLFMAMEYVEGLDLTQLLRLLSQKKVPLPAEFAVLIVSEVLAALDFAHRARSEDGAPLGLVHRDVSPSNVLLSIDGEVKLCDFGIAKATAGEDDGSEAMRSLRQKVVGKSAYMAPEHARGELIDARADVFAAGILLWELCAGRRLYKGTEEQMLALAKDASIPPLPTALPEKDALQAVLDRALAPDREQRFPTARAFREALDAWAVSARLVASQIRFGAFLEDHVGLETVALRRQKERAAAALEMGPPVVMEPLRSSRPTPAPVPVIDLAGPSGEAPLSSELGEHTVPNQKPLSALEEEAQEGARRSSAPAGLPAGPSSSLPPVPQAAFVARPPADASTGGRALALGIAALVVLGVLAGAVGWYLAG